MAPILDAPIVTETAKIATARRIMTIQLNPEQEQVIGRAIQAGLIETADDVVEVGVETIKQRLIAHDKLSVPPAKDLVELFASSPFAGLNMDFERDQDTGREVEL
jgi:hypothetical protein